MNQRRKPSRAPRPSMGPKNSRHWNHRRCCPYWYEHDWDWDWDDDYEWDDDLYYYAPHTAKAPRPVKAWDDSTDSVSAYQQGFKDGWYAAMEYMSMYSGPRNKPMPAPAPEPTPPMPPTESTSE